MDEVRDAAGPLFTENSGSSLVLQDYSLKVCPNSQVTGMTQRDVMGRKVGGGFMFGNACTPVVDSCQCMANQYSIVK